MGTRRQGEPIWVLHVDDDPDFADMATAFMKREDESFEIETATSASKGLDLLASSNFDCVVSDYDMPGQTGIEFLEAVRDQYANLPFILFTGKGSEEIASDAISAGVTDYLQKSGSVDQYALLANRIRNATKRAQVERELRRSERRFTAVFEDPQTVIAIMEPDGTLLDVNQTALARVSGEKEDVLGEPFWEEPWWDTIRQPVVRKWIERAADGEYVEFEVPHITPDGREWHVSAMIRPVRDDAGNVVSLIASGKDITQRKLREQEVESQNERLNQFATIVSHDLRNPLNVAQGQLELAREECDSTHLNEAASAVSRCETLIDELLTLARTGEDTDEMKPINLVDVVEMCWRTIQADEATLVTDTNQTLYANQSRLRQLIENLIQNAIEHGGPDVTVRIGNLDEGFYVEDDGPGISEGERAEVFEPGYSTAKDGTGVGLNIVREIVKAHGWEIRATDGSEGGARFEITGVEFAT